MTVNPSDWNSTAVLASVLLIVSGIIITLMWRMLDEIKGLRDSHTRIETLLIDPQTGGLFKTVTDLVSRVTLLEQRPHPKRASD